MLGGECFDESGSIYGMGATQKGRDMLSPGAGNEEWIAHGSKSAPLYNVLRLVNSGSGMCMNLVKAPTEFLLPVFALQYANAG